MKVCIVCGSMTSSLGSWCSDACNEYYGMCESITSGRVNGESLAEATRIFEEITGKTVQEVCEGAGITQEQYKQELAERWAFAKPEDMDVE